MPPDASGSAASQTLADQALENLVNQFARPLDFLRELVQNSIDAGSPRVEVSVAWSPPSGDEPRGVVEIHVQDSGEGMDEHLIDSQLTRMFSSTKEDDLTKIGKFGIGFTSIFAIQPDAVLLRTGRHTESWELLFHADRSFDKIRLDVPVSGTRITLFKRMMEPELEGFVRECRWVLAHWCEHSNTPVTFHDRTHGEQDSAAAADDPFAAFAAEPTASIARGPERLSGPMVLHAELQIGRHDDGVELVVGYAAEPRYGFYNGGLTLLSTRNRDALGGYAARLGHLCFKVKSDQLEHTLTRDNVLQDNHWRAAMDALVAAADALAIALLDRIADTPTDDPLHDRLLSWLAAECRAADLHRTVKRFDERVALAARRSGGDRATLAEVQAQEDEVGAVLLAPPQEALCEALVAEGLHLIADRPGARALLAATWRPPLLGFGQRQRRLAQADALFVQPELVDPSSLPSAERALVERTAAWVAQATSRRVTLRVGRFGGDVGRDQDTLAVEGPADGGLFQRPQDTWFRLPAFLRRRCLLVNRHHPAYQAQVVAAAEAPALAAFALAQAILFVERVESEGTFEALVEAVTEQVVGGGA